MECCALVGLQWGDEGKGKIVDCISDNFDAVIRFQGGSNAGHTIHVGNKTYKLSSLPSGIIRSGVTAIIGNGVVVDHVSLANEIKLLTESGIQISSSNLVVADAAPILLSAHKAMDEIWEGGRQKKIDTTKRGIGPCYEDNIARRGFRVHHLKNIDALDKEIENFLYYHNTIRTALEQPAITKNEIIAELKVAAQTILPYTKSLWKVLKDDMQDKKILFEGAQGALLDINHGTYPFVTSSTTLPGSIYHGCGLSLSQKIKVTGIIKSYTSRVGNGPFPTEANKEEAELLRSYGKEYGTVTKRPRRCGWLDCVLLNQAIHLSGTEELILTKLDTLDTFKTIRICTAYEYQGKTIDYYPTGSEDLNGELQPIYQTIEGWNCDTSKIKTFNDLPQQAKNFVQAIEKATNRTISMISNGPDRENIIHVHPPNL